MNNFWEKLDLEIKNTKEYLKYNISQINEKHLFHHHSKVKFTSNSYFNSGDSLLKQNQLCKLGVGNIYFETDNYFFTRQFNGVLYSKKEYFENKEHNKMVYAGLYNKPYFGNKKLFKELNNE